MELDHRVTVLEGKVDQLSFDTRELCETMHGNGHPGLRVRVDRLEQRGLRRTEQIGLWLAVIGSIGGLVAGLASWFR